MSSSLLGIHAPSMVAPRSLGCGVIASPPGFDPSRLVPTKRLRLVGRVHPRLVLPLVPNERYRVSLFLNKLTELMERENLYAMRMSFWIDGGKRIPTEYHNDLWRSAPLTNRVLQLWVPLLSEGPTEEIEKSMLRVDPRVLPDGWSCPSGLSEYRDVLTGATEKLSFNNDRGRLQKDLPGVVGGQSLQIGDTLFFDSACCHYTLPSKAFRLALAMHLSYGEPVYNGYFDSQRPLDGKAGNEEFRKRLGAIFKDLRAGQAVPVDTFVYSHLTAVDYTSLLKSLVLLKTRELRVRLGALISKPISSFVFSGVHRESLLPEYDRYARYIVAQLAERISLPETHATPHEGATPPGG